MDSARLYLVSLFRDQATGIENDNGIRRPYETPTVRNHYVEKARLLRAAADWLERNGDQEETGR